MGSVLTEIQTVDSFPRPTGRMVGFTIAHMNQDVQLFNTSKTTAKAGDYIIDAGEIGFDVMTPEFFHENYRIVEFNEETQFGTAELLDSGYPI